jgi:hypothetical protein
MQFNIFLDGGWEHSPVMKFFALIIIFAGLWLLYLIGSQIRLFLQIKKYSIELRKKWQERKKDFDAAAFSALIIDKNRNRFIFKYFRSLAEKASVPFEQRIPETPRLRMDIDRFLAKRELHLRSVAMIVIFSLGGLLLAALYYAVLAITWKTDPTIADVITEIRFFALDIFPSVLALGEAFLSFWMINGLRKMSLRLDDVWAGFLDDIARG